MYLQHRKKYYVFRTFSYIAYYYNQCIRHALSTHSFDLRHLVTPWYLQQINIS
jgi:hypothetical protein